jgi:hypothetical protein
MVAMAAILPIPIEIIATVTQKMIGIVNPKITNIFTNCLGIESLFVNIVLRAIEMGKDSITAGIIFDRVANDSMNSVPSEEILYSLRTIS